MSELVERMRKEIVQDNFVGLLDEAADRIEQLEAALRSLYEWYDRDGSVGGASDVFEDNRVALGQKADDCKTICMKTGLAMHDWSDCRVGARGYCGDCPRRPRTGAGQMSDQSKKWQEIASQGIATERTLRIRIEQLEKELRLSKMEVEYMRKNFRSSPPSAKP
jgi:hypothetical protein